MSSDHSPIDPGPGLHTCIPTWHSRLHCILYCAVLPYVCAWLISFCLYAFSAGVNEVTDIYVHRIRSGCYKFVVKLTCME